MHLQRIVFVRFYSRKSEIPDKKCTIEMQAIYESKTEKLFWNALSMLLNLDGDIELTIEAHLNESAKAFPIKCYE